WISTTTISAAIHHVTGRAARRCQASRPVPGEVRGRPRGDGDGAAGEEDAVMTTSGGPGRRGGGQRVGARAGTVPAYDRAACPVGGGGPRPGRALASALARVLVGVERRAGAAPLRVQTAGEADQHDQTHDDQHGGEGDRDPGGGE